MARSYARINTSIWRDPTFRSLTSHAQYLYFALASSPDTDFLRAIKFDDAHVQRLSSTAKELNPAKVVDLIYQLRDAGLVAIMWNGDGTGSIKNGRADLTRWTRHSARSRDSIPDAVRALVFGRDGHRCVTCGSSERLSLDHIYPWSLGGSDDESNLQTLCMPCNVRKGARI